VGVGEEAAAAGRLCVAGESELGRQGDLRFAAASGETVQPGPVDPAFPFGEGLGQVARAQWSKQGVADARVPLHDGHRLPALRLRPLTNELTGDDEIETVRVYPFPRLAQHEDLAVETRVEVGAVAVARVEHDVLVLLYDIDDVQPDTQSLGHPQGIVAFLPVPVSFTDRMDVVLDTEAGVKVGACHMHTLPQHDPGREQ